MLITVCSLDFLWTYCGRSLHVIMFAKYHRPSFSLFLWATMSVPKPVSSQSFHAIMFALYYRPSFSHSVFHEPQWDTTIKVQLNVQFAAIRGVLWQEKKFRLVWKISRDSLHFQRFLVSPTDELILFASRNLHTTRAETFESTPIAQR